MRFCHTTAQSTSLYYSVCTVFMRLVTFEWFDKF
jgi:hypothetical protein